MAKKSKLKPESLDLSSENIHWNFRDTMSYGDYLQLDKLLDCQQPMSSKHDEMLFLVIHQASELWIKLCLHEISAAISKIQNDDLGAAFKMMSRVARIQTNLIQSWEILSTLTPADYSSFREELGKSSGFQSYQYRALEFRLGNKNVEMLRIFEGGKLKKKILEEALREPSIYDQTLKLLKKRGFSIPHFLLSRDFSESYVSNDKVRSAWKLIYSNTEKYWDIYELAEKLVDLEYRFHLWRFTHMKTVERIIGGKSGTGGSSGVEYLKKALSLRFYPELWEVRTDI